MNAVIIETEKCKHGFRHLIRCSLPGCKGTRWVADSDIKNGKGQYCSNMCRIAGLSALNRGKKYKTRCRKKRKKVDGPKEYNPVDFAEFVRIMTKMGY